MKQPFRRQFRLQASLLLLALQVVASVLHGFTSLVYSTSTLRTTTRVVAEIQGLGHAWVLLFGGTAVYLGVTLYKKKGEAYGHLACATVWLAYATGLWIGALADSPHGTVLFPSVVTFLFGFHYLLASTYNCETVGKGPRV